MDVLQIPSMLLKGNYKLKTLIHSPHWVSGVVSLRVSRAAAFLFDSAFLSALLPACVLQADILAWNTSSWNSTEAVVSPFHPILQISQLKTARLACSGVFGLLEKRKVLFLVERGKRYFLKKTKTQNSLSQTGSLFQGLELGGTHQRQSVLSPETHGSEVMIMGTVCQQHKPLSCSCLWARAPDCCSPGPQSRQPFYKRGLQQQVSAQYRWASPLKSTGGDTITTFSYSRHCSSAREPYRCVAGGKGLADHVVLL